MRRQNLQKRTYKIIDLIREADIFYKLIRDCQFESYAYSVNSFKEIRLFFILKNSSNEDLEISMDAKKIVYNWD